MQALPALVLFLIYASMLCGYFANSTKKWLLPVGIKFASPVAMAAAAAVIFVYQITQADGYSKINNAARLITEKSNKEAIEILQPLQDKMQWSEFYWRQYGNALYGQKDYSGALQKYKQAAELSANFSLQMQISNCYAKLRQYDSAVDKLLLAGNMIPNRLGPKYRLMKIYQLAKDSSNACKTASQLLAMQPKGISKKAQLSLVFGSCCLAVPAVLSLR